MTRKQYGITEVLGRQSVHPFPARMAPSLALNAVRALPSGATVLDPMVGSGTVLAIARANGHRGLGFDIDPLAVLTARVWTRTVDANRVRATAEAVLIAAREVARFLSTREAYPWSADDETKAFIRYWFDIYARKQLAALSQCIADVPSLPIREVLWCAFSRQIISKQASVSLALDLSHSRPHRVYDTAPQKPLAGFLTAVQRVLAGCVHSGAGSAGPRTRIAVGDARKLGVPSEYVDLVFTSPPYLNAIDYVRCSKFSLVWMGHTVSALRGVRRESIGSEAAPVNDDNTQRDRIMDEIALRGDVKDRTRRMLQRYVDDTLLSLGEVARVLKPNGRAVYVVGENTIRGVFIPTGSIVTQAASEIGLTLVKKVSRKLPPNRRYLPPPGQGSGALDGRMGREVVLTFGI